MNTMWADIIQSSDGNQVSNLVLVVSRKLIRGYPFQIESQPFGRLGGLFADGPFNRSDCTECGQPFGDGQD